MPSSSSLKRVGLAGCDREGGGLRVAANRSTASALFRHMSGTRERVGELSGTLGVLASPSAVAAVTVLLLNDHVLKQAWPSPITGKLSDFAGLYFAPWVLISLALAVTPRRV